MRHPEARRVFQPSEGSRAQHICIPRDALSVTNEHQGLWEIHARSLVPLVSARDFGMTHTYWEERMRHLEARRFFQPSEGSRAEHICTPRDALSVTNEHQGTVGDPRKIPRPAGECAGLRDDAFSPPSKCASSRSPAHSPAGRGILRASPTVPDVHSSQTRHLAVCKYAAREIPRSAGKNAELRDDAFGWKRSHEPRFGMTHCFLPVSVRHPEVPRTHQRDEGSRADLPQSLMFIHHRQGISRYANMLRARSLARPEHEPSFGGTVI